MRATYGADCPGCHQDIKPGQQIVQHRGMWWHRTCWASTHE